MDDVIRVTTSCPSRRVFLQPLQPRAQVTAAPPRHRRVLVDVKEKKRPRAPARSDRGECLTDMAASNDIILNTMR